MNKMSNFQSYSRVRTWFMALLLSALVAGCGGGDGGGGGTNPTTTVSGIAASGAPVIGGTVQMVCAGSTPGTAVTTGPDGGFTVTAPSNAPCVIRVSGGTNNTLGTLITVVASSSQTRANVNPLTHMLASLLAGGNPDTGLFQSPSSISSKITTTGLGSTTAVATHKATITASVIANLGAAAGIPTSFDFLEGTFTANHTGFDLVLDKIGFTAVGNTVSIVFNGAPLLAVDATTGVASTTSSAVISAASLAGASTFGAPVTAKAITAYSLAGVTGTINETAKTIAVNMPNGTNVTALVATFTTTGAGVKVGAVAQTSGTTANDFTSPVAYTVTAADGTTATYTVTVTVTVASSSAKAITAYSLNAVAGTIDETAKTIAVNMPNGTNVTALVATFTTTGAGVKVGAVAQTSGTTANDFTSPVAYTVTAADGTTATYTVTVTVASSSAKAITAYSLNAVAGSIDETAKTIAVTMPNGTNVTALVATFTTTGTGVKVGAVAQTSGTTPNDFTSPVAYTVTAADSTTATYTVTVTVAVTLGPAPVNLGTAGNFVILAKTGVSTTGTTAVVGDIGLSPAAASYITGFGLIADSTNTFSTSSLVTGKVYAADYTPPTPSNMTTAVSDMETAFTDAAGRALPDFTELYAGDISGRTLVPGLYKWGTGVLITNAGVTLSGGPNDVWIFQIAQDLTVSNSAIVTLSGGAQAKNIFWQVSGQATLGTAADFKGIILSQTLISLNTGAVMIGRALAQSAVTLNATAITAP